MSGFKSIMPHAVQRRPLPGSVHTCSRECLGGIKMFKQHLQLHFTNIGIKNKNRSPHTYSISKVYFTTYTYDFANNYQLEVQF